MRRARRALASPEVGRGPPSAGWAAPSAWPADATAPAPSRANVMRYHCLPSRPWLGYSRPSVSRSSASDANPSARASASCNWPSSIRSQRIIRNSPNPGETVGSPGIRKHVFQRRKVVVLRPSRIALKNSRLKRSRCIDPRLAVPHLHSSRSSSFRWVRITITSSNAKIDSKMYRRLFSWGR